jgi:hypothetical protein
MNIFTDNDLFMLGAFENRFNLIGQLIQESL